MSRHPKFSKKIRSRFASIRKTGIHLNAYEPQATPRTREKSKKVLRDLVIVFMVFSVAFVLSSVLDLHSSFEDASLQLKASPFQYDEIVAALAVLAAALSVFAVRRWRDLETEIDERIKVEEALVDSEERYRTLAEAAQDIIFIVDRDNLIQYVNSFTAAKLNDEAGKFAGRQLETVFPEEMAVRLADELKKVFADGQPLHVEHEARFGEAASWLSTSLVPIRDDKGGYDNVLGIARDITTRKLAEDELQRAKEGLEVTVSERTGELRNVNQRLKLELNEKKFAEDRLQAVNRALRTTMAASQALTKADEEAGLLREICRAVVEVGGYRFAWVGFGEEEDGRIFMKAAASAGFEKGYLDAVKVSWERNSGSGGGPVGEAIRTGAPHVVRDILVDESYAPWRAEASSRGYASTVSLPLAGNDEMIGSLNIYAAEADAFDEEEVRLLSGLANDLSYGIIALRTRGERDEQAVVLKRSGEQLSLLLQSLPIIFYTGKVRDDFGITYVSDNVTTFTGYTPEEVTTDSSFWMDHIHPDDAPLVYEELPKVFDRGYHEYEYRWRSADGSYKWFLDILRLVKAADGEEDYIVGMWLDITARKQGEERLLQVKDNLEDETRLRADELHETQLLLEAVRTRFEQQQNETALFNQMDVLLQNCVTEEEAYAVFARFASKLSEAEDSGTLCMLDEVTHDFVPVADWGATPPIVNQFGRSDCWSLRLGHTHIFTGSEQGIKCAHAESAQPYLCAPVRVAGTAIGVLVVQFDYGAAADEAKIAARKEQAVRLARHLAMNVNNIMLRRALSAAASTKSS